MPLQHGARLGAFEILTLIGSGGMGEVYRARDTKLNREVAIKTYQGRAREGLKTEGFANSYRRFVEIRGAANEDPLLVDARRRVAP